VTSAVSWKNFILRGGKKVRMRKRPKKNKNIEYRYKFYVNKAIHTDRIYKLDVTNHVSLYIYKVSPKNV
jgi:hypothetical protein